MLFKVKTKDTGEVLKVVDVSAIAWDKDCDIIKHCLLCVDSEGEFVRVYATDVIYIEERKKTKV